MKAGGLMKDRGIFGKLLILMGLFLYLNIGIVAADSGGTGKSPVKSPPDWLKDIEVAVVGQVSEGGLVERLNALEDLMTGRVRTGTLDERLTHLDGLLYVNQPYDICLFYKIQALDWSLYRNKSEGSIKSRLEKLEKEVFGSVYSGPMTKRVERLIDQVFPDGVIKARWANIPDGLLVKVRILDELNSVKNKPGDRFRLVVTDTITDNHSILFPEGSIGEGVLGEVTQPENLGRDAQLRIDFAEIRALDATPVRLYYGSKALKMVRSRQLAFGASAAGMLAFGPGGILLGLVIKGKETTIPAGTEFYLEITQPVRIYTLFE
jgi:hypothetical protein